MMKRLFLLMALAVALSLQPVSAQGRSDRLGMGAGIMVSPAADATVFWEHETRYHNAWEVFAEGYLKYDVNGSGLRGSYGCWGVGAAWKPCILRSRNRYGNMRMGVSCGSNTDDFVAGIHLGFERSYVLHHGWRLYWRAGMEMRVPKRDDLIRGGLSLGFMLPVSGR